MEMLYSSRIFHNISVGMWESHGVWVPRLIFWLNMFKFIFYDGHGKFGSGFSSGLSKAFGKPTGSALSFTKPEHATPVPFSSFFQRKLLDCVLFMWPPHEAINPSLWSRSTSLFFSEAVGPFGVFRRKIVIWKASPVSEKGLLHWVQFGQFGGWETLGMAPMGCQEKEIEADADGWSPLAP